MIPARQLQLKKLQEETFDLLIIGGGATGSGIALDAATRRYRVALVEGGDFSSGTSSRSTKLIHGGVRYLEDAVKNFDWGEYKLVWDSLHERATFLKIAPHLTRILPIFTPVYSHWERWYFGWGMKLYDLLSGSRRLKKSRFVSKQQALQLFPSLKSEKLKGGILYYDGQFDDARMNVSLILTAITHGAVVSNYLPVVKLNKKEGKIISATVRDHFTQKQWDIQAKVIVNATGPFVDEVRRLDDPNVSPMVKGSRGSHLLLDRAYCPGDTGLLIPKTTDGRVLFLLPWEGSTLLGTTDIPTEITHDPKPTHQEINYLLEHLNRYLSTQLHADQVKSSWSGIRPLIAEEDAETTAKLSRDFKVERSPSKLYSIAGGKWTSYRKMAEDLLDEIIRNDDLPKQGSCITQKTLLVGAEQALIESNTLNADIVAHLQHAYGNRANIVIKIAQEGYQKRLAEGYPFIEAEVIYAMENEFACTAEDILFRRTRLATLDQRTADQALPRVKELMEKLASCP